MLLDPAGWSLAQEIDRVLPALEPELGLHVTAETHKSALELRSRVHKSVAGVAAELGDLRGALDAQLRTLGLRAAASGTHPFAVWQETRVSTGPRYQRVYDSMRELARREPTFALHVHVGVASADAAIELMNRMRGYVPLLLALSGNSPLLAGARHRPGLRPHAALPGLPARGDPARVPRLRGLGRGRGRAAALRGLRRADLPVVGRAPAAALRHRRGPDPRRAEHRVRDRRADRAGAVHRPARARRLVHAARGARPPGAARGEPLHRDARRHGRAAARPGVGAARAGAAPARPAARGLRCRTPRRSAAWTSSLSVRSLAEGTGAARQLELARGATGSPAWCRPWPRCSPRTPCRAPRASPRPRTSGCTQRPARRPRARLRVPA